MIELNNVENQVHIKCQITGYQFPDSKKDDWCLLKVEVEQSELKFERIDPAIETTELVSLYDWFKCLSERKLPRFASLSLTEPCIKFKFLACTDESVRISITLDHELKPNFELKQFGYSGNKWEVVFDLDDKCFDNILDGINKSTVSYPVRGGG